MTTWTEDRVDRLKRLWSEGLSGTQIAAELGGTNRNSVIGKVHRLGLPGRTQAASIAPKRRSKKEAAAIRGAVMRVRNAAAAPALAAPVLVSPKPPPRVIPIAWCSILDLTSTTCRWIIGDSRRPLEPIYCGATGADNPTEPYCKCHRAMAGAGHGRDMSKFKAA